MGEIADMMLDGTLCEGCGCYLEGGGDGFPRYCSARCAGDRLATDDRYEPRVPKYRKPPPSKKAKGPIASPAKVPCPDCGRFVSPLGLKHHQIDKHGDAQ